MSLLFGSAYVLGTDVERSLPRAHVHLVGEVGVEVLLISPRVDPLDLFEELLLGWAWTFEDALMVFNEGGAREGSLNA